MQPLHDTQLVIVDMMKIPDLTNCTRIRMWQPVHAGINISKKKHYAVNNSKLGQMFIGSRRRLGHLGCGWPCSAQHHCIRCNPD